jgi:hypothetical protein
MGFSARTIHNNGMPDATQRDSFPADWLNRECFCIGADRDRLHDWLRQDLAARELRLARRRNPPAFVFELPGLRPARTRGANDDVIKAIQDVETSGLCAAAIADAPAIARHEPKARGVFFGTTFLGANGPQLIEIPERGWRAVERSAGVRPASLLSRGG